ncbi:hypothetical protein QCB07_002272 [Salmonella enterica]|nr:hypothetical protein [Salmonella enterica]
MKYICNAAASMAGTLFLVCIGNIVFSTNALASASIYPNQGCSNLGFTVKIAPINPDPVTGAVEVSGVGINTPVASLVVENINPTARCDTGFSTSPFPGDVPPGKGFIVYRTSRCDNQTAKDSEGIVGIFCSSDGGGMSSSGILEFAGDHGPAPVTSLSGSHAFTLQSKNFIGRKVVDIDQITNAFHDLSSTWGGYTWSLKPVAANVVNHARELILTYTPTCSASVNNVDFGIRTVDELNNGVRMQANVNISCNDILPAYSIKISSDVGMSKNGIINSENSTLGYRLTWGDLTDAGLSVSNQPVILDSVVTLINGRRPSTESFNIPLNIEPVSIASSGVDISPGSANSRINIELKFN